MRLEIPLYDPVEHAPEDHERCDEHECDAVQQCAARHGVYERRQGGREHLVERVVHGADDVVRDVRPLTAVAVVLATLGDGRALVHGRALAQIPLDAALPRVDGVVLGQMHEFFGRNLREQQRRHDHHGGDEAIVAAAAPLAPCVRPLGLRLSFFGGFPLFFFMCTQRGLRTRPKNSFRTMANDQPSSKLRRCVQCGRVLALDVHFAVLRCGHVAHLRCALPLAPRACPVCTDRPPRPTLGVAAAAAAGVCDDDGVRRLVRDRRPAEELRTAGVDAAALFRAGLSADTLASYGYGAAQLGCLGVGWVELVRSFRFDADTWRRRVAQYDVADVAKLAGATAARVVVDACGRDPQRVRALDLFAGDWHRLAEAGADEPVAMQIARVFGRGADFLAAFQRTLAFDLGLRLEDLRALGVTYADLADAEWTCAALDSDLGASALAEFSPAFNAARLVAEHRPSVRVGQIDPREVRALFRAGLTPDLARELGAVECDSPRGGGKWTIADGVYIMCDGAPFIRSTSTGSAVIVD